ncbi:MAG: hypothetical protein ACLUVC_09155 [Longibaculum sp.]
MTKFFLYSDSIYDEVILKGHRIFKTILFYKEFDEITGRYKYLQKIQKMIYQIENMNRMKKHFIQYQYSLYSEEKLNKLVIEYDFLPTLEMYCMKNNMNKKELDQMVIDILEALNHISFHGDIKPQNIYLKGCHFYLGDVQFENILSHYDEKKYSKQEDLKQLKQMIYQLTIKNIYKDICYSVFFKREYRTVKEFKEAYLKDMNYLFYLCHQDIRSYKREKIFGENEYPIQKKKDDKIDLSKQRR